MKLWGLIALVLTGCAQPGAAVCALQPMGLTDSGFAVVRLHCFQVD